MLKRKTRQDFVQENQETGGWGLGGFFFGMRMGSAWGFGLDRKFTAVWRTVPYAPLPPLPSLIDRISPTAKAGYVVWSSGSGVGADMVVYRYLRRQSAPGTGEGEA